MEEEHAGHGKESRSCSRGKRRPLEGSAQGEASLKFRQVPERVGVKTDRATYLTNKMLPARAEAKQGVRSEASSSNNNKIDALILSGLSN